MATCTLHRVETNLSCRTCGTPVCPDCAVRPPMGGVSCAEHAGGAKKEAVVATRPRRDSSGARGRMLVGALALVVAVAAGVVFLRPSDGGDSSSPSAGGDNSSTSAGAWTKLPSAGLAARGGFSYVSTGRSMIVWGGAWQDFYADGAAFDVATSTWTPLAAAPISARDGHSAVWTGTHMIVFGGIRSLNPPVPLGQVGPPPRREALNDGASYDPATDRWSPIAPAPLAGRNGHSAVWVQNKMVVWGGLVQGGAAADGASYDPMANSWTPLPPAPLEPRISHHTVATADRMLVWGGANGSTERFKPLADGAIYSPADNAWTPMAPYPQTTETPGRHGFSSVWTGTHMLVWGGYAFTEACRRCVHDDGAAYDPNTDSWALMTRSGLSARGGHGAVWTGKEMVVWGGVDARVGGGAGPPHVNDGAAYNPADGTWSQLPDSPLLGRGGHAMVWVGEKLVVWGGGADYTIHDDGAVLTLRG